MNLSQPAPASRSNWPADQTNQPCPRRPDPFRL